MKLTHIEVNKRYPDRQPGVARLVVLLVSAFILSGGLAFASYPASDSTSSTAYHNAETAGTNFNGLNGGSGFGPWVVEPNPVDPNYINTSGDGPEFSGNSVEDNINTIPGGDWWAIYADELNSTDSVTATRAFTGGGLSVDQIFSTVIEFRNGDPGSQLGLALQDNNGNTLFSYSQEGGSGINGLIVDAAGLHSGVNAGYNYETSQNVSFVLTSPTNYVFSQNGIVIYAGTIAANDTISQVTYFETNNNDGLYIRSLLVSPVYAAFDSTADPVYAAAEASGTNFEGLNGGSGFQPWVVLPNPVDPNYNDGGALAANVPSLSDEDNINTMSGGGYYPFWAIYSDELNAADGVAATRVFSGPALAVYQTFTTEVEFRNGDNNSKLGFELQDANGNSLFNFYQVGNSGVNGFIVDATGLHSGVNSSYNYTTPQTLSFLLTSATNYTFSQNGTVEFTGTIAPNDSIKQVTYYTTNNNDGLYFQSLSVSAAQTIAPSFTSPDGDTTVPAPATNFVGGVQRFTAVAYGTGPLTYQWSRSSNGVTFTNLTDGGEISGSLTSALTLTNVTSNDAAYYELTVTGPGGPAQAVTSVPVTLTVIPPVYTSGSDTIQLGSAIIPDAPSTDPFNISSGVTAWMYFQPIGSSVPSESPDGTAYFTIPTSTGGVGSGNDSQSYLSFSGGQGPILSSSGDRDFAYSGGTQSFTHTLLSTVELVNVWYVFYNDAVDISVSSSGGGNPSLTLNDFALPYNFDGDGSGENHSYGELSFLITGSVGDVITFSTTPDTGNVTGGGGGNGGVQAVTALALGSAPSAIPPSFTNSLGNVTAPTSATMFAGGRQRFTAVAYGTPPLTYQWSRSANGTKYTNLVDGGEISGSATPSLTLADVTTNDALYYKLTVTGPTGPAQAAVSPPVTLTVIKGQYTGVDTIQLGSAICPNAPVTSPYDISANVTDWEYFEPTGTADDGSEAATGPHSFSEVTEPGVGGTGGIGTGYDSTSYLNFEGGDGADQLSVTNQHFSYWFDGNDLSFTHTLFAPVETVTVWYCYYNNGVDITVSSSGQGSVPLSLNDFALPYNPDGDGTGEGHGYGALTYLITGEVGDVITFNANPDNAGVTGSPGGGSGGVQAVSASGIGIAPQRIPLALTLTKTNAILSWQGVAGAGGMNLQSSTNLPGGFSVVPITPSYNGTNDSVIVPRANNNQFFELH